MKNDSALSCFLVGLLLCSTVLAGEVKPILVRRVAVEDRPLFFKVTLAEGGVVKGGTLSRLLGRSQIRVGDEGLEYVFLFRLLDHEGTKLSSHRVETEKFEAEWKKVVVTEPYTADFEEKLVLEVTAQVRKGEDEVHEAGVLRARIPRVQDVTGPLQPSHGDEEEYPEFQLWVEGDGRDGVVTTQDRGPVGAQASAIVRNPFPLLADDGLKVENDGASQTRRGCLVLGWRGLYDNLNEPFWGKRGRAVGHFALVISPRWDLSGSHYLVRNDQEPHLAAEPVELSDTEGGTRLMYSVDLSSQIEGLDQSRQPFGEGRVAIPLPYDRVGELQVGFLVKDVAWPRPNSTVTPLERFTVRDDIAPHVVLSFQRRPGRRKEEDEGCRTIDALNRAWLDTPLPWGLPQELPAGVKPSKGKVEPHVLWTGEPERLHVFTYDNTRLEREALSAELAALSAVDKETFGFRREGQRHPARSCPLERDAFDPSSARTDIHKPWMMMFEQSGRYRLTVEAFDIHGNRRVLKVPLLVKRRTYDVLSIYERERRR